MNGAEAATRQNQFPTDLRVAVAHEFQKLNLLGSARGEIRMPALGGHHAITRVIPKQNGLAQARSRRDQGASAAGIRLANIQDGHFVWSEMIDAVTPRAKIIHQHDALDLHFLRQRVRVDDPGKIGGMDAIADDWAGNAEAGCFDFLVTEVGRGVAREFLDDEVELGKILARESLLVNHVELAIFSGEERKVALGSAHITSQNHRPSEGIVPVKPI